MALQSCSTIEVKDFQHCSPLPGVDAVACDYFLSSHQQIITTEEWVALQAQWGTTQCISSQALGDMKKEIEKFCSINYCAYEVQQILSGLDKMMAK